MIVANQNQKTKNNLAYKYILIGQCLLFFFLFICIALIPHYLFERNEGGISNYGTYAKTVVPFSLSTLSGAAFAAIASFHIAGNGLVKWLKYLIRLWAAFATLSLVSTFPYKHSAALKSTHEFISLIFVIFELLFSAWMALFLARNKVNFIAWTIMLFGFILGVLNFFGTVHILMIVEIIEGLAFAVILVNTARETLPLQTSTA